MRDQFERNIEYMRISVTDRCNLRCRYCMPADGVESVGHDRILRYDELLRLVRLSVACGIKKVKITGGEPLVRKGMPGLVRDILSIPGMEEVTMTTNGLVIGKNPEVIHQLAEAGLSGINISLDTLDRQRYEEITGTDGLADVMKALDVCCSVPNLKVKVNVVTLADYNLEEVASLASLAKDRHVDVRFIEVMPIGLGARFKGYGQAEILPRLEKAYGPARVYDGPKLGNGPAVYYDLEGFCGRIGFISALSHSFCSDCNRVRLTSEGFLKPCLHYAGGMDLRKMIREGADDGALLSAMREGIYKKPHNHQFIETDSDDSQLKETSGMSYIGG